MWHHKETDDEPSLLEPVELQKIEYERIFQKELASNFKCVSCLAFGKKIMITACRHIFCKECAQSCISDNVCSMCKSVLEENDVCVDDDMIDIIIDEVTIHCKYACHGCPELLAWNDLYNHECDCKYYKFPAKLLKPSRKYKGTLHAKKQSLLEAQPQYVKRQRLAEPIKYLRNFCTDHHENIRDVLFFMLKMN